MLEDTEAGSGSEKRVMFVEEKEVYGPMPTPKYPKKSKADDNPANKAEREEGDDKPEEEVKAAEMAQLRVNWS